ncbi:hypothetical protein B296_00049708 [Ensete ventricosum]|uniref:Uncharacterized protein n=1 Tax=Ensete ventricosum TaxID=4639 RepID=A0A426YBW0_ENSVE|nr:hypothetical protein B296_00049708 [Ensete ventricosum]
MIPIINSSSSPRLRAIPRTVSVSSPFREITSHRSDVVATNASRPSHAIFLLCSQTQPQALPHPSSFGPALGFLPCPVGTAHKERGNEQDEQEVGYSQRAEEAQSGVSTEKRSHKERLIIAETHLDLLKASLKELYQGLE